MINTSQFIALVAFTLATFIAAPQSITQAQAIKPSVSPTTKPDRIKAPDWAIQEWVVGPPTSLEKLRGKVVIIDFFQLWCPGCNAFSIPLMERWEKKYAPQKAQGKIAFVSIHTVFEGHSYQNNKKLRQFVAKKGMKHPVGVDDRKTGARIPITMERYKTYGTPEMVVIDKKGFIRFQKFGGFDIAPIEKLIESLMSEDQNS